MRRPSTWSRTATLTALVAVASGCVRAPEPGGSIPQRIVAVAPNVTETLFLLGLGDRVVGVGSYANWPPEVAAKPRIGGLYDVQFETIVRLEPDLAVLLPSERQLADRLTLLGIEVLEVPHETLEDIERAMLLIAERVGLGEAGRRLAAEWRQELAPRPLAGEPRVALTVARAQGELGDILVAGSGTFLDELLRRMSAVNAFGEVSMAFPQVGVEALLARAPDVVVELQPETLTQAEIAGLGADWRRVGELATACTRVIAGGYTLLPGPRLPRLYRELRQAIASCAGAQELP